MYKKTDNLKVAILLGSLNRGGTETLLLDMFRNIQQEDVNVLCVYRMGGVLYDDFIETGVSLTKISPKVKFDLSYIFRLRGFLKTNRIEIAHAQQPLDALYAYLACIGLKTKVLFTMHGYDFRYGKLTRRIISFIHKRTDINLFVSKNQRDYFIEKYHFRKDKTRVLYNGVSFDKFDDFQHASIRKEFSIPRACLLIGSVGNFNPARDQMMICRFLNLLNMQGTDFTFIFAGSQSKAAPWYWDDCRSYCYENGLQKRVVFAGLRNDIPNFLSQLDAFVYATDHDTFGIAVIEAIYMGIPAFINDWKVFEEITNEGRHANLYQTRDEKDLLKKFLHFAEKKEDYLLKAKSDASWAKAQYSIQNHIDNLLKAYESVLSN